ncbi:unnamed protein product [Caenorhabditis brenneri]
MFPLLNLPENAIRETIRVMDFGGILALSLTSKRSKQHVSSARIKAISIGVRIGEEVSIEVETSINDRFYVYFPGVQANLTVPKSVIICFDGVENPEEEQELDPWKCTILQYQDWLKHLREVFNYQCIEFLEFYEGAAQFDLQKIKEVFGKADPFFVRHTGCYLYNQLIIREFFPMKSLSVDTNVFEDSRVPSNILIQNFDSLLLPEVNETITMNFNDLLLINAKQIDIINMHLTPKDLNRFLKLWIKGANPRMDYLCIPVAGVVDENELMKGIKHQKLPSDRMRTFSHLGSWEDVTIKGGFDFYRKDGLKATINVFNEDGENLLEMFVWQESCVVTEA